MNWPTSIYIPRLLGMPAFSTPSLLRLTPYYPLVRFPRRRTDRCVIFMPDTLHLNLVRKRFVPVCCSTIRSMREPSLSQPPPRRYASLHWSLKEYGHPKALPTVRDLHISFFSFNIFEIFSWTSLDRESVWSRFGNIVATSRHNKIINISILLLILCIINKLGVVSARCVCVDRHHI